jgi:hypothetical protein
MMVARTMVNAQAVGGQIFMTPIPPNPTAVAQTVVRQVAVKSIPATNAQAVGRQVLMIPPTNTQDYNVLLEVSSAGFIPANDYGVHLEVAAALPYGTNDGQVYLEVAAASTLTPAKPMQRITWFTPA